VGPSVNLIAQYLRTGQREKALNLARNLQVGHPDNPDLLDLLGKSQLANGSAPRRWKPTASCPSRCRARPRR
jgi:hypothetical protein